MTRTDTAMAESTLHDVREIFHAAAETVVPELARQPASVRAEVETVVERALADRPPPLRRQLVAFLRLLNLFSLLRFGRRLTRLDPARRARLLTALQDSPVLLLRRGVWGLRTLIFLGYYTRPAAAAEIGWRAHREGWSARGLPDESALAAAHDGPAPG